MYNQNYSERPIPLVAVNNKTGKYEMTEEAIKFLKSVPAPLGVVSVAGLYRTGKSYLLNRMILNTEKPKQGFGVGPTINPCTKGLWCWGTPIKGKSSTGQAINIIVIDTQGIGALDEDQTHDTRIFTLAILASSCFIYNSVGSIDQTAVQNLSLVVNLSKHIQIKSTNKSYDDQEDAEQMAHHFPTFYWVVRDFSLQLQDTQGNAITSRQYLQKALAPLKSSSQFDQDIQEKNRIRKLLTSFFKDRDCFTMVRPLVDETKLQDLDGIPQQELRLDFVQQVMQFRKRVTQGLKIKTFNGKQLNGDMYCNMISSYVGAINDGAVPNIQNAWNYMCQQQCQKIQEECQMIFDKELKDNMKFPVEEEYFESTCENAFEICLMNYREKAIGDMALSIKFEKQLKQKIKQKIKNSRQENAKASKQYLQKKVLQVFNPIMEQLKKQHFKTFEQFQKVINSTYQSLVSNSPNLPFTRQKYLELYKKVQRQGAQYIFKCLSKQMQNMKSIFKQKQDYYENLLENTKVDQQSDRKNYGSKISQMDREKIQAQNKIQRLQFELEKLNKDKQSQTQKLSKNLTFKKQQFQLLQKNLQSKVRQFQEKYDEISKNFAKQQKIWEKDRALMDSKIKQQITTIQELEKQKQIMTVKYQQINNQTSLNHKETLNRTERKVGEMENQIKKLKQSKFELNENLKSMKDQFDERCEKFERTQKKLKEQLNSKKRQCQNLKNQMEMEKKKHEQSIQEEIEKITKTKSTLNQDFKRQKEISLQLTQELRKAKSQFETKQAELEQRIKFSEDEKRFLKDQLEQNKRIHYITIQELKIQNNQVVQEKQKIRIEEVRIQLTTEIKNINITYENQKKKYIYQTETLRNSNKQMELQLKVFRQQLQDERNNFKQYENQTIQRIQLLEQQLKNLERTKQSTLMEKQALLKKKILDLQSEIQSIKQKNESEHRQAEERNKQCIIQLRVAYERQRQDLQNNYLRQKQRAQKKFDEMVEQYETKHRQEIQNLEEQLENVRQDAAIMEESLKNVINDYKYGVESLQKENQNLKNQVQQLKALLAKKQQQFSRKFEHLSITSRQEREQLIFKMEALQQQFNQLEKDLMNINHEKQRLTNELEKTKNILKDTQSEYKTKKQEYFITLQQYKKKLFERQNDLMELKINYEKQTALLSQQNQHISDKNNQLLNELSRINEVNQQKIKKIKADSDQTVRVTTQKYSTQRNLIQEKYDKSKKTFKQNQSALNKKLNEMEKEKAVDTEKISNLQMKFSSLEERKQLEIINLQRECERIKQLYKNDKLQFANESSRLKDQIQEIIRKKTDIQTKYDKDTLLLKNQVQNEINIRQARQASYNQNIRQLQSRIDNLQRTKSSQQSKAQSSYNEQRVRIEETYRTKISQYSKSVEKMTRDYDDLSKRYEYETKDLKEMLAVQRQAKDSLQNKFDKKTNEWQEIQRRLNHENDILKSQREQRGLQFQKQLQKQKQSLKLKLNDYENRLRSAQKQKSGQFMQYQRQKARFSQQFSSLTQEMQHLKDKIAKLQKDKAKLDKDNERLKIEKRTNKTASYIRFNQGLQERKSTLTIRKDKVEKKQTSDYKYEEEDKQNIITQQMLLD